MPLPDIPTDDWQTYQADTFSAQADQRIDALSFSTAANSRIAQLDQMYAPSPPEAPTPLDSLTNPLGTQGPSSAGTEAGLPPTVPSSSTGTAPPPAQTTEPAPAFPAPDAPAPTSFTPLPAPEAPLTVPLVAPSNRPSAVPPIAPSSPMTQTGDPIADALNAADRYQLDPHLFLGLLNQESGLQHYSAPGVVKTSPAGARGIGQLMPDTARGLGVNPDDPAQNLDGAARYLRQNIDRYGGDVVKALAAYNAGAGNVDKYGGVPPFAETQKYVDSIMSSVASNASPTIVQGPAQNDSVLTPGFSPSEQPGGAKAPTTDISQFGNPQLTADEAYAACGPAAAVRFAQRFGRNPTLREATDLAAQVGWTVKDGMAGLGSEQALMTRMGIPTRMVTPVDANGKPVDVWSVFANEAQTGNPVTISTPGHYFTADGYDTASGKFHVGRSGLDLKGGSEWMSPQQMQSLMGQVQGGLLADNPQVPAPSTADQSSNPLDWLGRQKDALTSGIQGWFDNLGSAATSAITGGPQPMTAAQQPTPSDTLTNPTIQKNPTTPVVGSTQPPAPQPTVFDAAGQVASDVVNTLPEGSILRGGLNVANAAIPATDASTATMRPGGALALQAESNFQQQRTADDQRFADLAEKGPENWTPDEQRWVSQYAVSNANVLGSSLKVGGGPAYTSVMPEGTFETSSAPSTTSLSQQLADTRQAVTRVVTRTLFDRQVDINQVQQQYAKALGRPLNADEMAAELQRLSADPAAQVKIDEGLKPAIQSVGDDYNALRDYVTLRSNVQVAEGAGTKAQQALMATDAPSNLRSDLNAANTSLRMRQTALSNLQNESVPDQVRIQIAQRGVNSAQRAVQRREDAINAWITSNTQSAATEGANVAERRRFSGGMTAGDSQQAMQDLEQQLGPERFQTVKNAADQVSQFSDTLRQRLVDSSVLSQEQADTLHSMYPDWAKTRILDYMADPAGGQGAGTKIGLADRQLRQYSLEGTTRAREDPLASTVAYTHQVERMANKNEAFNAMLTIDQSSPTPMLRQVAQDFTPTKNQVTMIGFVDGQKVKYVTDNKALGEAINGAGVMSVPEWTSAWQKVFRSLATSRNPVFLAGNAALDIPTYAFRTAIRDGGPQALPGIMADLARGYGDAFQGLLQGEYRGAGTAAFLKGGGGQSGYFTGNEGQTGQAITDLRRSNVFQINGKADILRLAKDLVTLKPVEALGERIELGPRVAACNRALARGANPVQAVIDGRTVTVDFSQGGTATKYVNNFIPFFNVGFQGPVQLARAWRDNPRAFLATTGTLIGLPTVAAEVWNRADPQRAQDYADVPQYVKDQGVVVMLPGDAPIDAQGNRKPLYAVLKLREWAPFASIARDATARALGDDSKSLTQMVQSAGAGVSPTQSTSVGQLGTEALSGIPVLPAAAQIQFNQDFFRGRTIVSNRADQNASAAAKALTPTIQAATDKLGLNVEIRPSAVDFFIRNQGAGVGGAALGASDIAAGTARQDTSPTSLPGVGGLIGRFVGNQTGQGLQTARTEELTPSARQILRQNGITNTPGPASSAVNQIPLKLDEETRYQQLLNRYVDDAIHRVVQTPEWATMTQQGKDLVMQRTIGAARTRAGAEALSSIPEQERLRRLQTKSTAPSAPTPAGVAR